MPTQWQPAPPAGERCVFCRRTIGPRERARAVWDMDQDRGWQVLGFHVECRTRAADKALRKDP